MIETSGRCLARHGYKKLVRAMLLTTFACMALITNGYSAEPTAVGLWQKTENGKPVAWYLVVDRGENNFEAVLVKAFSASMIDEKVICNRCSDDRKNKPLIGMSLVRGMKRDGLKYEAGNLLDPRDGRVYSAKMRVSPDGQHLTLQGYFGLSMLGSDESWSRISDVNRSQIDPNILAKVAKSGDSVVAPARAPEIDPTTSDGVLVSLPPPVSSGNFLQPVFYATNRKIEGDGAVSLTKITYERSPSLKYGIAVVNVPKSHAIGAIERPKFIWKYLSYETEQDDKHFVLKQIDALDRAELIERLRDEADSVLLFVHGYNVDFRDAMFRAAQISYDANFAGATMVFSWPSAGKLLGYDYDVASADFSKDDLLQVLRMLTSEIGKKRLYVVAHSLGNQVLTGALYQAALSKVDLDISELVLAAPDVDKDWFFKQAANIRSVAKNMTLYASSADRALLASAKKAWGSRMGYIGPSGPNLVEGVDVIDVTAVGDDMLGLNHGTFAGSRSVIDDLGRIITSASHLMPQIRSPTLRSMPDKKQQKYWQYPR